MKSKKYVSAFMVLATVATLAPAVSAFAEDSTINTQVKTGIVQGRMMGNVNTQGMMNRIARPMMKSSVAGVVTAISGNTITISSHRKVEKGNTDGTQTTPTDVVTTFTVDATNAKIIKGNSTTSTISDVTVGDSLVIQGTLTGTNIVATSIFDGKINTRGMMNNVFNEQSKKVSGSDKQDAASFVGNGQPIVAGTVSAISGSTITITNKSNVTYTIDATNAKVAGSPSVTSISNVAVGDMLIVQGAINGNNVVATTVIDQAKPITTKQESKGFFAGIGSFFGHMFGF